MLFKNYYSILTSTSSMIIFNWITYAKIIIITLFINYSKVKFVINSKYINLCAVEKLNWQ